jgi:Ca2+/Na+ antiporter
MKNINSKRKFRTVLIAAILGAVFFDSMILIENLTYIMWRHGHLSDYWHNYCVGTAFLLEMPSAFVSSIFGFNGFLNEYVVNGLLGAIVFAFVVIIWQFILKGGHENKTTKI